MIKGGRYPSKARGLSPEPKTAEILRDLGFFLDIYFLNYSLHSANCSLLT